MKLLVSIVKEVGFVGYIVLNLESFVAEVG